MVRDAMLRDPRAGEGDPNFRWRGRSVSRLENLADIIFAFALSLVLAAEQAPASFAELIGLWREVVAFGLSFAVMLLIWRQHYLFFRRYGLSDGRTVLLNAVLLFLVLIFAYPLKFIFSFVIRLGTGGFESGAAIEAVMNVEQAAIANIIYAVGFAAVFGVFALMHLHALGKRGELELDARECVLTRYEVEGALVMVGVAFLVILMSVVLPTHFAPFAGFGYFFTWPGMVAVGMRSDRKLRRLAAEGAGAEDAGAGGA